MATRMRNGKANAKGRRMKRGNGTGGIAIIHGYYYLRLTITDEHGQIKRKVVATHRREGETPIGEIRQMLDEAVQKYALDQPRETQAEKLMEVIHHERLEREEAKREAAERERVKAEAEAKERAEREAEERDRTALRLDAAFSYFVSSKKRSTKADARTMAAYERQFGNFVQWVKAHHPEAIRLRDITGDMAEGFIDHLDRTRSHGTRNKFLTLLRAVWKALRWEADAQLTADPWEGIRAADIASDTVRHKDLTFDELCRVVSVIRSGRPVSAERREGSAAGGIRDVFTFDGQSIRDELLLLFAVGVYTGLRLGDCALLTWGEVDLAFGTIKVMPRKTARHYKNTITIPIHQVFGQLLTDAAARTGGTGYYVMPVVADMYQRQPSTLTNRIQPIFKAAGIETTAEGEHGTRARVSVGFHSLRHFFASWLDNHGTNHELTNYLTSHSQGTVEARYFHAHREALQHAIETLPTLPMVADEQIGETNAQLPAPAAPAPAQNAPAPAPNLDALRAALRAALARLTPEERAQFFGTIGRGD